MGIANCLRIEKLMLPTIIGFAALACARGAGGAEEASRMDQRFMKERAAIQDARDDRRRADSAMGNLTALLRKPPPDDPGDARSENVLVRAPALQLLGEHRAGYAAELILNNLMVWGSDHLTDRHEPKESRHWPATRSLVQIGSPAIPELFQYLEKPRERMELLLVAHIFLEIDGAELAQTRLRIEMDRRRANLDELPAPPKDISLRHLEEIQKLIADPLLTKSPDLVPSQIFLKQIREDRLKRAAESRNE